MAARNLREAAALAARHPERAPASSASTRRRSPRWRDAADAIVIPYDEELRRDAAVRELHAPTATGTSSGTPAEHYPLLLHYPYYLLYSSQVVKQADLVFALYACGDCFSAEQRARDFEYYERITVRDSSLSACVQAIVAAEVGHVELAYDYLGETAFIDLRDLAFNTKRRRPPRRAGGLLARRRRGLRRDARPRRRRCTFAPRLPARLDAPELPADLPRPAAARHGRRAREARYELLDGEPLEVGHHGERVALDARRQRRVARDPAARPRARARRSRRAASRRSGIRV